MEAKSSPFQEISTYQNKSYSHVNKSKKKSLIRVCCKLDDTSMECLNLKALKAGVSKAKVLNHWIGSSKDIAFQSTPSKYRFKNFNFRATPKNYELLLFYAKEHNTNVSKIIRAVIFSNSNYISNVSLKKEAENIIYRDKALLHYQEGRYNLVVEALKHQTAKLGQSELSNLIQSYMRQGEFDNAIVTMDEFQHNFKRFSPLDSEFYDLIVRGDIYMYSRYLSKANEFFSAAELMLESVQNRGLIGYYYCLKGEYEVYLENPSKGLDFYETALEYLDIINHNDLILRLYIRMRRLHHMVGNTELKDRITKRLQRLLAVNSNLFYKAWVEMDDAFYFSVSDEFKLSESITKSSIDRYTEIENIPGKYYGQDNLARLKVVDNDLDSAYKLLQVATQTEAKFRKSPPFSYSRFYMYFIEAKHNLSSSVEKMQKVLRDPKVVYRSYGEYIMNSAILVFGENESKKITAKKNLYNLSIKSANSIIRKACVQTLTDGKFHAVR